MQNNQKTKKAFFDLSEGIFHKGVAHLYCVAALLLSIISVGLLLSTPKVGSVSVSLVYIIIIPVIVTGVLSILTFINNSEKMYRVYTLMTIGYALIVVATLVGVSNVLKNEAVQKFFQYSTVVQTTHKNVLPGITLIIMIVVGLMLIGIVFNLISLVLVTRNVKGAPRRKAPQIVAATIEEPISIESETEVE